MTDEKPIIRLTNVHKAFKTLQVLKGVNLNIQAGKTTVVIGPSGCGKSVMLKHIVGLIKPDTGHVFFREKDISTLSERQLVPIRRKIGFLFQGAALFDSMTVEQNVIFPLVEHDIGGVGERKDRCREVLGLVGLDGLQDRFPENLSGGQKKRVALARAIALGPEVILYDEPTTGLDPVRSDLINELILKLQAALGVTSVVVTHDMASARKVGDRILMLSEGHFVADTTSEGLEHVANDVVAHFIHGEASQEELAELERGSLADSRLTE